MDKALRVSRVSDEIPSLTRTAMMPININEPMDNSPTGRLLEGVIESIDEFYSANLGQDIRRGMRENAARGFFNGSRPPYGYRKVAVRDGGKMRHKLEPEPEDSTAGYCELPAR